MMKSVVILGFKGNNNKLSTKQKKNNECKIICKFHENDLENLVDSLSTKHFVHLNQNMLRNEMYFNEIRITKEKQNGAMTTSTEC